jgi:hypothetical protein
MKGSKILIQVAIFSVAMGFLEAAVVVYLREMYYPRGFESAPEVMSSRIIITELLRELATIIMLAYIGIISGKTFAERFSLFLFSFAIWDIFYYVFLKAVLNWPASVFIWDILFLIPVPWLGPVLAPCIISLTMILLTLVVFHIGSKGIEVKFRGTDWIAMITASVLYIFSFTDGQYGLLQDAGEGIIRMSGIVFPERYKWELFMIPQAILLFWLYVFWKRHLRTKLA